MKKVNTLNTPKPWPKDQLWRLEALMETLKNGVDPEYLKWLEGEMEENRWIEKYWPVEEKVEEK